MYVNQRNWQPDNARTTCNECEKPFTVTRRRHHCRGCGLLFCGTCNAKTIIIEKKAHKCCSSCKLADMDKQETLKASNNTNATPNSPRNEKSVAKSGKSNTSTGNISKSGGKTAKSETVDPNRARELEETLLQLCRPNNTTTNTSTGSLTSSGGNAPTKRQQAQCLMDLCEHYLGLSRQSEEPIAKHEYFLRAVQIVNSAVAILDSSPSVSSPSESKQFYDKMESLERAFVNESLAASGTEQNSFTEEAFAKASAKTIRQYREMIQCVRNACKTRVQALTDAHLELGGDRDIGALLKMMKPLAASGSGGLMEQVKVSGGQSFAIADEFSRAYRELLSLFVRDAVAVLGPPPGCEKDKGWACYCLGSMARSEMCGFSDVEFGILVAEESVSDAAMAYFRRLSQLLRIRIINMGETKFPILGAHLPSPTIDGYCLDPMLSPFGLLELITTPRRLAEVQCLKWVNQEIILANSLNCVALVEGDPSLISEYELARAIAAESLVDQEAMQKFVGARPKDRGELFACELKESKGLPFHQLLALELLQGHVKEFNPDLVTKRKDMEQEKAEKERLLKEIANLETEKKRLQLLQLNQSDGTKRERLKVLDREIALKQEARNQKEERAAFGIKKELYRPFQEILSSLAIYYQLKEKNSLDRIDALTQLGVFPEKLGKKLKKAMAMVLKLRLSAHVFYGTEREELVRSNDILARTRAEAAARHDPDTFVLDPTMVYQVEYVYKVCIPFHRSTVAFLQSRDRAAYVDCLSIANTLASPNDASVNALTAQQQQQRTELEKRLLFYPTDVQVHINLAKLEAKAGSKERATQLFQAAISLARKAREDYFKYNNQLYNAYLAYAEYCAGETQRFLDDNYKLARVNFHVCLSIAAQGLLENRYEYMMSVPKRLQMMKMSQYNFIMSIIDIGKLDMAVGQTDLASLQYSKAMPFILEHNLYDLDLVTPLYIEELALCDKYGKIRVIPAGEFEDAPPAYMLDKWPDYKNDLARDVDKLKAGFFDENRKQNYLGTFATYAGMLEKEEDFVEAAFYHTIVVTCLLEKRDFVNAQAILQDVARCVTLCDNEADKPVKELREALATLNGVLSEKERREHPLYLSLQELLQTCVVQQQ